MFQSRINAGEKALDPLDEARVSHYHDPVHIGTALSATLNTGPGMLELLDHISVGLAR